MTLSTNDVRVLRLLLDRGQHSYDELNATLRNTRAGAEAALRRIPSLGGRGLITNGTTMISPHGHPRFDITTEGVRQLRRADEAAYGRSA